MIRIYYNPECSKCREGLCLIEESGQDVEIVEYLKEHISEDELAEIIQKLKIKPIELVRKNENIWIENYEDRKLNDKEIIGAMIKNPELIERPVVINGNKAIIGRPPVLIKDIL